ncbi:xanthine dehydrogenase family protein molybdopterin-binding subunit [Cupriavidus respiraculi]|uniref:xanthine dehydrogenase family protein molybdopterin-binding subunit n=1 Tax=Cupriavidus respiraculi TaxID=195930 RepID=UPI001C94965E|nr:xanthine dehydrogenase family protein molybdopterin-binding subunit [Cupriavidus respiraculi]MBY4945119.1 xanthine dehydrogenase family protein molybdopterin-binding subunit [Cupriavidus respiraculi]
MNNQAIGASARRIDGRLKVTGAAPYTADRHLSGMLHAYGVFSTVASGRVTAIDTDEARRVPGVVDVFHHERFLPLYRAQKSPISATTILTAAITDEHRLPFEDANVYYFGQFVALVVADTFEHAREAAYRVKVSYAPGKAVANLEQGLAAGKLRDGGRGHSRGAPAPAFDAAPVKVDAVYHTPVETHTPMEMHASVAWWSGGDLHLFEASQGVVVHRNTLAQIFGLTPERVTVEAPYIGSGFGSKLFLWPHSVAACAAARLTGRPVKLVVPRAQMFTTTGQRPETKQRLRVSANADGRITSIRHESVNTTSFIEQYVENCGGMTSSVYACPNVLVSHHTIEVHRGAPTSMRAPGAAPGLFALESAIDEVALACRMDPVQFRLANISTRDESTNLPWSSNHMREAIEQGAQRFGWHKRDPRIGSMVVGSEIAGYGVAVCNWDAWKTPAEARVQLRSDGTATVVCAIQDIGTGTYTIAAQTVSELTGLPLDRIDVRLGDSSFPAAPVSGGSWATASVLPAIAQATRNAIGQLRTLATQEGGAFAGAKPDDLRLQQGRLTDGKRTVDYQSVLSAQRLASADGHARTDGAASDKVSFMSFGAHFVEVRWDPGISRLRVARVVSAIDVGRVINPLTARNQVEGAIVMGVGMALFEATEYDPRNGIPGNNNCAEYVMPVHADQPDIDVILLDYPDLQFNEFGARGIGEIGITGLAAAVANGVYHATGRRIRDLPITMEKLMEQPGRVAA